MSLSFEYLISAIARFSFKLFDQLTQQHLEENLFVSPVSLSIGLALLSNGARGETLNEIINVLGLKDFTPDEINEAYHSLISLFAQQDTDVSLDDIKSAFDFVSAVSDPVDEHGVYFNDEEAMVRQFGNDYRKKVEQALDLLNSSKKFELWQANALWIRQGSYLKDRFSEIAQRFYEANISEQNFSSPDAVNVINNWIREYTRGRIDKMLTHANPDETVLVLANIIGFMSFWKHQFEIKATRVGDFHLPNHTLKPSSIMHQSGDFLYLSTDSFEAISLPYSHPTNDADFRMDIFLPGKESNLTEFHKSLDYENWQQWRSGFQLLYGTLGLPRFQITSRHELIEVLMALGVRAAFAQDTADFSQLADVKNIFVSDIFQGAVIDVDENGTKATAATIIETEDWGEGPTHNFTMLIDRPFFFVIQDNATGLILFMGNVFEPL